MADSEKCQRCERQAAIRPGRSRSGWVSRVAVSLFIVKEYLVVLCIIKPDSGQHLS